jgi:hypothetical protein
MEGTPGVHGDTDPRETIKGRSVCWYLPPGQVRKWATYCRKYAACDVPVYFVRMDDNPGKLGQWKIKRGRNAERSASARALGEPHS